MNLVQDGPGTWRWESAGKAWATVEQKEKANLFSRVGIGARTAIFHMHPRALSLHQAIRWRGQHFFLTAIVQVSPTQMTATTAVVEITDCTARRPKAKDSRKYDGFPADAEAVAHFPAVLAEKYAGFVQQDHIGRTRTEYVLVTPKPVRLEVHDLVDVNGAAYIVQCAHGLDLHKNEYELLRKEDA